MQSSDAFLHHSLFCRFLVSAIFRIFFYSFHANSVDLWESDSIENTREGHFSFYSVPRRIPRIGNESGGRTGGRNGNGEGRVKLGDRCGENSA